MRPQSGAHCHAGVRAATLLKEQSGLEASSVAFVRKGRCTGRIDCSSGRCDLLRTREARFDSASHWSAIEPPSVRMSVVCVRRSRERGLDTRSVRRQASARRRFSRLVTQRDGRKRCLRRASFHQAPLCRFVGRAVFGARQTTHTHTCGEYAIDYARDMLY